MKNDFLLPPLYKKVGLAMLLPFVGLGLYVMCGGEFSFANVTFFALVENGEWFHDIILHVEEDMDNAFIEIKVGTEDGDDSLSIASTSLGKAVSGKGIIKFDHLSKGKIIIKVQFTDKQRHTIKLR